MTQGREPGRRVGTLELSQSGLIILKEVAIPLSCVTHRVHGLSAPSPCQREAGQRKQEVVTFLIGQIEDAHSQGLMAVLGATWPL